MLQENNLGDRKKLFFRLLLYSVGVVFTIVVRALNILQNQNGNSTKKISPSVNWSDDGIKYTPSVFQENTHLLDTYWQMIKAQSWILNEEE